LKILRKVGKVFNFLKLKRKELTQSNLMMQCYLVQS